MRRYGERKSQELIMCPRWKNACSATERKGDRLSVTRAILLFLPPLFLLLTGGTGSSITAHMQGVDLTVQCVTRRSSASTATGFQNPEVTRLRGRELFTVWLQILRGSGVQCAIRLIFVPGAILRACPDHTSGKDGLIQGGIRYLPGEIPGLAIPVMETANSAISAIRVPGKG